MGHKAHTASGLTTTQGGKESSTETFMVCLFQDWVKCLSASAVTNADTDICGSDLSKAIRCANIFKYDNFHTNS